MSRTVEALIDFLDDNPQHREEFLKFERVEKKFSPCSDLHAFILLELLAGTRTGQRHIVAGAEHDVIYLEVDMKKLAEVITDDHLVELIRCGVVSDRENDSLMMFV